MKSTLLLLISFILMHNTNQLQAQSANKTTNTVTGKILSNNVEVENATVKLLLLPDSTVVKTVNSSKNGIFNFTDFSNGTYIIAIQKLSHQNYFSKNIIANGNTIELGEITLTVSRKALADATVTSKKPMIEVKADKTIVNVDANINNIGSNALEVLQTAPGVLVDKDGKVSLKGNSSVMIYIDGRPSYISGTDLVNMLTNMQSSQLETIEIMTNPPAKYDAAGNAGIINIKTKKSKLFGFNGSVNLNAGVGMGYPRFGETVNLNYRKNKFNVFGNVSHNYREGYQRLTINRNFMSENMNTVISRFSQVNEPIRINRDYSIKAGADYYINKKTTIGTVVKASLSPGNTVANGVISLKNGLGVLDSTALSQSKNVTNFQNISTNANLRHVFDSTGKELTIDLDYIAYNITNDMTLSNAYYKLGLPSSVGDTLFGDLPQNIKIYSAKADYQMPINKTLTFEAGLKTSFVQTDANASYDSLFNGVKVRALSRANFFSYKENINAAYVNFNKKYSEKFSVQAGLRLETTNMKGKEITTNKIFTRNLVQLFPTAYIQYQLNTKNSFVLNYGRRINRPDYQSLNPFIEYLDKYTYEEGNPFLQPEFAHNVELSHTYNQFLNTTINYNKTTQIINDVFITNANKTETAIRKQNIANSQTLGLNINANFPVKKWWTANINIGATHDRFNGLINNQPVSQNFSRATLSIDNQFKFKKGWSASVTGFYITGEMEGVVFINDLHSIDVGVGKSIWKNKGTIRLSLKDVFFSQIASGFMKYNNVDINFRQLRNSRVVNLSFVYRFNKGKLKTASQRKTGGADDEQKRVGGN